MNPITPFEILKGHQKRIKDLCENNNISFTKTYYTLDGKCIVELFDFSNIIINSITYYSLTITLSLLDSHTANISISGVDHFTEKFSDLKSFDIDLEEDITSRIGEILFIQYRRDGIINKILE